MLLYRCRFVLAQNSAKDQIINVAVIQQQKKKAERKKRNTEKRWHAPDVRIPDFPPPLFWVINNRVVVAGAMFVNKERREFEAHERLAAQYKGCPNILIIVY